MSQYSAWTNSLSLLRLWLWFTSSLEHSSWYQSLAESCQREVWDQEEKNSKSNMNMSVGRRVSILIVFLGLKRKTKPLRKCHLYSSWKLTFLKRNCCLSFKIFKIVIQKVRLVRRSSWKYSATTQLSVLSLSSGRIFLLFCIIFYFS